MANNRTISNDFQISGGVLWKYEGGGTNIEIPEGVLEIGDCAFVDHKNIKAITLPDGLVSIGNRCFEGCSALISMVIPDSVRSIGEYAFNGCTSLRSCRLPEKLYQIDTCVFKNCISLKELRVPNGVSVIDSGAFLDCRNLEMVYIPRSVTALQDSFNSHPFSGCKKLIIYTPENSAAEQFAKVYDIPFMNIDRPPDVNIFFTPKKDTSLFGGFRKEAPKPAAAPEPKPQAEPAAEPAPQQTPPVKAKPDRKALAEERKARKIAERERIQAEKERAAEERQRLQAERARKAAEQQRIRAEEGRLQAEKRAAEQERLQAEKERLLAEKKAEQERILDERARRQAEKELRAEEKALARAEKAAEKERIRAAKSSARSAEPSGTGVSSKLVIVLLLIAFLIGAAIAFAVVKSGIAPGGETQKQAEYSLEEFVEVNPDARIQIEQSVQDTNVDVFVSENNLIYRYDLSKVDGMSETAAKDAETISSLEDSLDSGDSRFIELCQKLEDDTGIRGISVTVLYTYGEDKLTSRTYTANGKY